LQYGRPVFTDNCEEIELSKANKRGEAPFPDDAGLQKLFAELGKGQIKVVGRDQLRSITILFPPGTEQVTRLRFLTAVAQVMDAPGIQRHRESVSKGSRRKRAERYRKDREGDE
jgi:hypothetical protein